MSVLKISNLSKSFGNHKVIEDLSFSVPEHSVYGFLGQNGAGKTTTMKMILGLLKANEGEIEVCGEKVIYGHTKTNRYIGYLPDVPEFYGYMYPREYLKLCGEITGMSKQQITSKTEELLTLVGLQDINKKIGGFSRGMKQRLGIAQALLNEPKLLICDEPTSALDPIGRKEILDILQRVKEKTTVVFSTHILSDVERICDHVAMLHNGKIVLCGTLSEIKEQHKQDSLLIEFENTKELEAFTSLKETKDLLVDASYHVNSIVIQSKRIKQVHMLIMQLLVTNNILPIKVEILEPTLETLFMEVVK